MCAFVDHGAEGTGEPLAVLLRAGNAGSNTATDHITVTKMALAQLPGHRSGNRPGRKVLVRTDGAGGTHAYLDWLHGQRLPYSVGFSLQPYDAEHVLAQIPASVWTPAYDADRKVRDGAFVAELTGLLDLTGWPKGMRVIARKERPAPRRAAAADRRRRDACGSPHSPPTPPAGSCPTSSCGTATAPAPKTGSASAKTPA